MQNFEINWTSVRKLALKYDYFLFDCDGVIWHGDHTHVGQSFRNIEWLESIGKKCYFVTNGSSKSREAMKIKMTNDLYKYKNCKLEHLYPSCAIAAQYIK